MENLSIGCLAAWGRALRGLLLLVAGALASPGMLSASYDKVGVVTDSTLLCMAPADTTLLCGDPALEALELLGVPQAPEGNYVIEALPVQRAIQICGTGVIVRSWRLIQNPGTSGMKQGPVCAQTITVRASTRYMLRFPADTTIACGSLPNVDTVFYKGVGCEALTVTFSDLRVNVPGETCFLVYRTYRVINWCEYDAQSPPVLLDRDADRDGKPGDEALWVIVQNKGVFLDRDSLPDNQAPNAKGHWTSSLENPFLRSRGYWEYQQVIRIVDQFAPQLSVVPAVEIPARRTDCTADVNLAVNVQEACTPEDLIFKVEWDQFSDGFADGDITSALVGAYPRFRLVYRMPFGVHTVYIQVQDRCGNISERSVVVTVTDARAPQPRCINSLVVQLSPLPPGVDADGDGDTDQGAVTIWARNLLSSTQLPDCSGPLTYSLHKAERIEAGLERPSPDRDYIVLTCDDRPTQLLYIYAWDVNGNYDYCETYILVQDPENRLCPELGDGSIAGVVRNVRGVPLEGVKMVLEGEKVSQTQTNKEGAYLFQYLKEKSNYSITPAIDTSHKIGVTTYDIVMIMRHILGDEPFTSPYQYLAADVDLSGTVTTLDVIQIRKLVLSLDIVFLNGPNFRFVPANLTFEQPQDILRVKFPEQILLRDFSGRVVNADLVAVKLGDVTGDALSGGSGPTVIIQERKEPD